MTERVLITGARAAAALDLARDFRAAGWDVHLADCARARISRWSGVGRVHRYPSPVNQPDAFRRRVVELANQLEPRLIVPTCEEAFHLAAPSLRNHLAGRLFQPPLESLRTLHDKYTFARLGEALGLPTPETRLLARSADLAAYAGDSEAWVFKPRFSRFGESACVGPPADRLGKLAITPNRPWIAQRRIRGVETSFYAVAREGRLTAFASYRSDWRLKGGASMAFIALGARQDAALRDLAGRIVARLSITGQIACDAIFDHGGQAWLIECNPRATSGVHFLSGEGALARAISGGSATSASLPATRIHLLPVMLSFGLLHAVRRGRIGEWFAAVRAGHDAIGRPGDRGPAIGALIDGCGYALSGLLRGMSTSAMTTADIEWNGEVLA